MKKTIKTILIIVFFICFLGCFFCPVYSFAGFDFGEQAYKYIDDFFLYVNQAPFNSILSQYFTYSCVGVKTRSYERFYNLVITDVVQWYDGYRYTIGTGSYYVENNIYHVVSNDYLYYYKDYITLDVRYYFPPTSETRLVTYCDLTNTFYTNPDNSSSLQTIDLNILPPFSIGSISSHSGTLGSNIISARDTSFTPVVTTLPPVTFPPFQPPATVPPILPPSETVTAFPAVTDDDNNYYVDYSPYIDGNFFAPPVTDDISLSPAISASGAIISEGFGWLTDSGVFPVLLVLMLVSFAIYNLI